MVLAALPPSVVDLHRQIEAFAGAPVDFRPASMLRRAGIPVSGDDAAFCDETHAHITVDDRNGINAEAVTHELLHIHRYWVEQVPQLDAVNDIGHAVEDMAWLDNALEHLAIVPRERDFGFDPTPHWAANIFRIFSAHQTQPRRQLRIPYLLGWTMTAYCTDREARKFALAALQALNLQRDARLLLDRLLKARNSKPHMARVAFEGLGLNPRNALLVSFDIRNRARTEKPIS